MSDTQAYQEAPEDSRALRAIVFVMSILCVASSSFFVKTDWWMTATYLVLIVMGSFLSYKFRHDEPPWLKFVWWIGILLVGANALHEFTGPLRDEFDFVSPFVHFLCGVFSFVTFSNRTRTDLNNASGLGLLLICLSAPVAKGLPYGICIFGYLMLGAAMMYFDCVSRTLTSWLSHPIIPAPEVNLGQRKHGRSARGNTILLLTVVPLLALMMFLYVPRADEFLDKIWAYTKTMRIEYLTDMFYRAAVPPMDSKREAKHSGREWFNKNKEVKQLPMLGKYKTKTKAELEMMKQVQEAKNKAAVAESNDHGKSKSGKPNKNLATKDSAKSEDKNKKKGDANKKVALNKGKDDSEKSQAESGQNPQPGSKTSGEEKTSPPAKPGDLKKGDATKDAAPKIELDPEPVAEDAARDAAVAEKSDKKADQGKSQRDKSSADKKRPGKEDTNPTNTKSGAPKDKSDNKTPGASEGKSDPPEGNSQKSGGGKDANKSGAGADGKGQNAGHGKDGKGVGKGGKGAKGSAGTGGKGGGTQPGGGKKGKGKRGKPGKAEQADGAKAKEVAAGDIVISDKEEKNLKLENDESDDERLVLTVKSRRLVYLRRQVYDSFNGRIWKRSAPDKKAPKVETIKVVDTRIKREPIVFPVVEQAPAARLPVVAGSSSPYGNTNRVPFQRSVLGNVSSTAPAPVKSEPIRIEKKELPVEEKVEEEEDRTIHPYTFEQTDRPIFKVGMADALKTVSTLPTVELVQEIKIKAKSIGSVVPGGWVEQEVKLPMSMLTKPLNVDQCGVITAASPLSKGMELKVKSELPIYPIEAMRSELPLSAATEDELRAEYAQYLQLPETMTEDLFKLAEDNSDPRFNWFVQSQQICDFLRSNYEYEKTRDIDAESKDLVQDFLFDRKRGNCGDFASSFVVMTRCVGIPSRMVTGFSPGDWNQMSGEQEVKLKHAHAWAEVYIPNFGWVPFDATPNGVLPSQQRENRYTQKEVEKQLGLDQKNAFKFSLTDLIAWVVAGAISLTVGVIAFKLLVGLYRRWREGHFGRGPEWALYRKVAKAIKKSMRLTRAPYETPTDFLERVRAVVIEQKEAGKDSPEMLPQALETFLTTYSAVYFGKRVDELEHLKYHAAQVTEVTKKIKPADVAVADKKAKNAVRRQDQFDETTSSAVRRKK